jgi:hypothetical protein
MVAIASYFRRGVSRNDCEIDYQGLCGVVGTDLPAIASCIPPWAWCDRTGVQ